MGSLVDPPRIAELSQGAVPIVSVVRPWFGDNPISRGFLPRQPALVLAPFCRHETIPLRDEFFFANAPNSPAAFCSYAGSPPERPKPYDFSSLLLFSFWC